MIATNKMDPFLARICTEAKETYDFLEECGCGEDEDECENFKHALETLEEAEIRTTDILTVYGTFEKCREFFDDYYMDMGEGSFTPPHIIVYRTDGNHMKEIMENLRTEYWH